MLAHAGLPNGYWAEAVSTAAYIRNRVAASALPVKTPFEMWYGKKPKVSHLRVFGCIACMIVKDENWIRRQECFVLLAIA